MFPDRWDKYLIHMGHQKPADDLSIKHTFKEIESQSDFYNLCLAKKACAIALLPAIT